MYYFLIYNDNKDIFQKHIENLKNSVIKYGKQYEIIIFNKEDIDPLFALKNHDILNSKRGGGYWLWKSYIISKTLEKVNTNDIIFYTDSRYFFVEEFDKLYKDHLKENDIVVWKNKPNCPFHLMKLWCKIDVIIKYDMYDEIFENDLQDCWAGAIVVKKTDKSISIIEEWLNICCVPENITDSPSVEKNNKIFREHRHDQSLLSIVLRKHNIPTHIFPRKYLQNVRWPWKRIVTK
jgi:hypothetical protein